MVYLHVKISQPRHEMCEVLPELSTICTAYTV